MYNVLGSLSGAQSGSGSGTSSGALRISLRLWRICSGLSQSVLSSDTCIAAYLLTPALVCFRLVAYWSSCGVSLTHLCLWTLDRAAPAFARVSASSLYTSLLWPYT